MANGEWNMKYVSTRQFFSARFVIGFASLVMLNFLTGCSSNNAASLTFASTQSDRQYSQQFNRAYYTRSSSGELDAVLIADGIKDSGAKSNGPILPTTTTPLNQLLHVRVRWRPMSGSKPDAPTATNAAIDWYIRSNEIPDQNAHLHYRGAGFVKVSESKGNAYFEIVTSRLDLADSAGRLQDPLGSSTLTGSFVAARNDEMVSSTLKTLQIEMSASNANQGPPPRTPQP
ncbi:MAG TPA: hypothetical protein VKK61_02195 [Tepidisphaeraceae bacterium]|nr:hypothetical protein [Tepidisphaeraceae bacterium]